MLSSENIVAQADDVVISLEDLEGFKQGERVEDTIIHFLCNIENLRFQREMMKYKFVSPLVTQLFQRSSEENAIPLFENSAFSKFDLIFFPISNLKTDNTCHWSLLVWCPGMKNQFLHFDSLKNRNIVPAKNFVKKIVSCLNLKAYNFKNMKGPIQDNSYDCGMYLMAVMDEIATTRKISESMKTKITPDYISKFRILLTTCIINYNTTSKGWECYRAQLSD